MNRLRAANAALCPFGGETNMNPILAHQQLLTRRHFFGRSATGIGAVALASLLRPGLLEGAESATHGGLPGLPHFAPKAKRVIYLFMSGGPSHIDLFDYHAELAKHHGEELPA